MVPLLPVDPATVLEVPSGASGKNGTCRAGRAAPADLGGGAVAEGEGGIPLQEPEVSPSLPGQTETEQEVEWSPDPGGVVKDESAGRAGGRMGLEQDRGRDQGDDDSEAGEGHPPPKNRAAIQLAQLHSVQASKTTNMVPSGSAPATAAAA